MIATKPNHSAMPCDLLAEQALLGSCLIGGNDTVHEVLAKNVKPETFFDQKHRLVFAALTALAHDNVPIESITVADRLRSLQTYDDVGGFPFLNQISDVVETSAMVGEYVRVVREHAKLRWLQETARKTLDAVAESQTSDSIAAMLHQRVMAVEGGTEEEFIDAQTTTDAALEQLCSPQQQGMLTGLRGFDDRTCGLLPGQLIVVAARPGKGKTAVGVQIGDFVEEHFGSVLFFSFEMGADELTKRRLIRQSRRDAKKLREGTGHDSAKRTASELKRRNSFLICDKAGLTVEAIASRVRRVRAKRKQGGKRLRLVIIDYLQLVRASEHLERGNRTQQIGHVSRSLKELAKTEGVPIVALAQLNRDSERQEREPRVSDLRECGDIEQDADVVLLIHEEEQAGGGNPALQHTKLILAKQRNGPTGSWHMDFIKPIYLFSDSPNNEGAAA